MQRLDLAHEAGNHCGSTALRDLSTYYGWGFDEPTCFGLASGLGFSFIEQPDPPERLFFGRSNWLEWVFFEHLGIDHELHEGQSFADAWDAITTRVDIGEPVMIFTDLYYLDYYGSDTHFSPHSLLVVGYEDDRVHLADSEFDDIQTLPLDSLEAALTSDHVVPLQCRYLTVEDPTITVPVDAATATAILETVRYMLEPASASRPADAFGRQGVPAIRALAADLPNWSDLVDPDRAARFAYENVERRGTGGGAFRHMYAEFLATAADRLSLPPAVPDRMREIAADWTAFGGLLQAAAHAETARRRSLLSAAGERADAIAEREAALYEDLRAAVD
jgi:hypothetical protein